MTPRTDMHRDLSFYRRRLEDLDEIRARRDFIERRKRGARRAERLFWLCILGWLVLFVWLVGRVAG